MFQQYTVFIFCTPWASRSSRQEGRCLPTQRLQSRPFCWRIVELLSLSPSCHARMLAVVQTMNYSCAQLVPSSPQTEADIKCGKKALMFPEPALRSSNKEKHTVWIKNVATQADSDSADGQKPFKEKPLLCKLGFSLFGLVSIHQNSQHADLKRFLFLLKKKIQ